MQKKKLKNSGLQGIVRTMNTLVEDANDAEKSAVLQKKAARRRARMKPQK